MYACLRALMRSRIVLPDRPVAPDRRANGGCDRIIHCLAASPPAGSACTVCLAPTLLPRRGRCRCPSAPVRCASVLGAGQLRRVRTRR